MSASSVTEYTDNLSENGKKYVSDFIGFMREQYPQIDSKICFSMPMWLAGEKMKDGYIAVSAAKNHFSIHFSEEGYVTNIAKMVPACKTGKQCINIKYGDDESYQIVKDHVRDFNFFPHS